MEAERLPLRPSSLGIYVTVCVRVIDTLLPFGPARGQVGHGVVVRGYAARRGPSWGGTATPEGRTLRTDRAGRLGEWEVMGSGCRGSLVVGVGPRVRRRKTGKFVVGASDAGEAAT